MHPCCVINGGKAIARGKYSGFRSCLDFVQGNSSSFLSFDGVDAGLGERRKGKEACRKGIFVAGIS